jgi:glycosyltransferase involved in cell wall biosynthesis
MQPKVSVVIPAHNEQLYIGKALRALLAQDYPDFEVIVVSNNSTDMTEKIAGEFPVTVLNEPRKGTMWACECGRLAAKGEIIVRMDADCVPDPDWLSKGAAHFRDPRVSAATGPYLYYDANIVFCSVASFIERYIYSVVHGILDLFHAGAIMFGGNSFMRASALEKIGGFDTSITFYGDDTDVAKRMSAVGSVYYDKSLTIKSSARRFHSQGTLNLCFLYLKNFLKIIFKKSPDH